MLISPILIPIAHTHLYIDTCVQGFGPYMAASLVVNIKYLVKVTNQFIFSILAKIPSPPSLDDVHAHGEDHAASHLNKVCRDYIVHQHCYAQTIFLYVYPLSTSLLSSQLLLSYTFSYPLNLHSSSAEEASVPRGSPCQGSYSRHTQHSEQQGQRQEGAQEEGQLVGGRRVTYDGIHIHIHLHVPFLLIHTSTTSILMLFTP
ncbi:hypothetical protein EON63_02955 [archaeon]|nr:MAG: hypothetical protein EON63_02955 [archaeon]